MESSPNSRSNVTTPKGKSNALSPVQIQDSPVSRSPQAGNLTGNPRIIRDNAAELYNIIQEWNSHHLNGVEILSAVTALKLTSLSETGSAFAKDYPPGISVLLDNLDDVCEKMKNVVNRMNGICKEMHSINKLEHLRHKKPAPMFLTWPTEKFCETAEVIYESYSKEVKLKNHIKENVAHCFNKTDILFQSVAWLHQPYISDLVNIRLEAMLKEAGHR